MRSLKIYIVILSAVFLTNCKKDHGENGRQPGDIYGKLSTVINVSGEAAKVFQNTFFQHYDTLQAFHAVGNFLSEHDQIESGYYVNRNMIEFTLKNGLKSSILFVETDANGNHKYRGGGSSGVLKRFSSQENSDNIKNENVLVLNPYISHFSYPNHSYSSYLPYFEGGNVKLKVTHFDGSHVRLSHINSMGDYGMVILNTHGTENSFSIYDLVTLSHPEAEDFTSDNIDDLLKKTDNYPMDKFENGELQMGSAFIIDESTKTINIMMSLEVTADYIKNSNLDLTDVVVFGNHCFSGFKSPFLPGFSMVEAWESKNVGTYYAYAFDNGMSAPANDDFCREVEISLIKRLAQDNDTTGIAHLSSQGNRQGQAVYADSNIYKMDISEEKDFNAFQRMLRRNQGSFLYPLYLTRYFSENLKWGCQNTSFTDPRDGEVYKVVCIGKQTWMAENLRYNGAGVCFNNDPSYCTSEGRLYSIFELINRQVSTDSTTVRGLCPEGWHVPSEAEFNVLIAYCGGQNNAVIKLRTADWPVGPRPTDEFGFNLKPTQSAFYSASDNEMKFFPTQSPQAYLWTSSGTIRPNNYDSYQIFETRDNYIMNVVGTSQATGSESYFHCRCVKD